MKRSAARIRTKWRILVIVLALSAATVRAEWKYYYFDEPRSLTLDTSQVAILDFNGQTRAASLSDRLATLGVANSDIAAWPIAGWNLVQVAATIASADGVSALVTQIAELKAVDFVTPVFVSVGGPVFVTRDILVGFRASTSSDRAEEILRIASIGTIQTRNWENMAGTYRIRSHSNNGFEVLAAANSLADMPEVRFAEPDMIFTGSGSGFPNDAGFGNCWGLHNTGQFGCCADEDMDAPEAWDITTGDPSVIVVVIDTGVQQNHPDVNQMPGNDFTSDASSTGDPVNQFDNHGTPVAGCVSASIDNVIGTVGVAPDCLSASARTFIATNSIGNWTSTASWTVAALTWAESIGARVTNNSNFYGFQSAAIASKYASTRNNGMVHFASAGNDSSPNITYPSSLLTVNAIVALNSAGSLASFSNFGNGIAFAAPGESVYTTDRTGFDGWVSGDYVFATGTSFASPYTAGVAALMLSANPTLDAFQVEQQLITTSVDLGAPGYDTTYGWGFVNANAAVQFDCNENGIPDHIDIDNGAPDCNGNGVPDECETDCNENGIPDQCDIADGEPDINDNGIPDDCEIESPSLAPPPHDILKNRYISTDPRGATGINVGKDLDIRLTLATTLVNGVTAVGSQWWANAPDAECIAIVGPTRPAVPPNWDACPTLHLTGCPIIPTSTYDIVVVDGSTVSDSPLVAATQAQPGIKWHGDCVGFFTGTEWTAPNGQTSIDDAVAAIKTFQNPSNTPGCPAPPCNATHTSVTDMVPNLTPGPQINLIVNIADVFSIIQGFQGSEYPGPAIELCAD